MKHLLLIAAGALALCGCASTTNAPYAEWADKRCAEVAPDYDRADCVAAYVEARREVRKVQAEAADEVYHKTDRPPLLRRYGK